MRAQLSVTDVERFVVDEQSEQLSVGDVDERLAGLGEAVTCFGIRVCAKLVEAVQVRSWQAVRIAFVEVSAQSDVAVGEREQRLALSQDIEMELGLVQRPWLDAERRVENHVVSRSSARSVTTMSAPCRRSSAACPTSVDSDDVAERRLHGRPPRRQSASSKTAACAGPTPSLRAAVRYASGAGLPASFISAETIPSTTAPNRSVDVGRCKDQPAVATGRDDRREQAAAANGSHVAHRSLVRCDAPFAQ